MIEKDNNQSVNKDNPLASSPTTVSVTDNDDPALLIRTEERQGSLPGNVRVRLIRPSHSSFRRIGSGILEATPRADIPEGGLPLFLYNVKRLLIGVPISNVQAEHERLTKFKALAVLSSDVISSVAYATEAILATLLSLGQETWG